MGPLPIGYIAVDPDGMFRIHAGEGEWLLCDGSMRSKRAYSALYRTVRGRNHWWSIRRTCPYGETRGSFALPSLRDLPKINTTEGDQDGEVR